MDNLARGWAIFWAHAHGHSGAWIAILTAILVAVWLPVWAGRRKRNETENESLRPQATRAPAGSRPGIQALGSIDIQDFQLEPLQGERKTMIVDSA